MKVSFSGKLEMSNKDGQNFAFFQLSIHWKSYLPAHKKQGRVQICRWFCLRTSSRPPAKSARWYCPLWNSAEICFREKLRYRLSMADFLSAIETLTEWLLPLFWSSAVKSRVSKHVLREMRVWAMRKGSQSEEKGESAGKNEKSSTQFLLLLAFSPYFFFKLRDFASFDQDNKW